jgi:hypothetical protein
VIVRPSDNVLHLITQPDHAALAGEIMREWAPLRHAERRTSILLAIAEHDNGWREPDAAPSVDAASGAIHDFIAIPAAVKQSVWPRTIARLAHDPWAAALVAQHAVTVYDRFRSDEGWSTFFPAIEAARNELVAQTPLSLEQLHQDYVFVRIGDLVSLIFCNQWQDESFLDWRFRKEGDSLYVTPDGFAGAEVTFAVRARELPKRPYRSDAELHMALRDAEVIMLHGTVVGYAPS